MSPSRLFVYKIIEDSGGAPCVQRGLLTLAICKPSIRRSAAVGDWIFAFGSNNRVPAIVLTNTGLTWCRGKTDRKNGIKVRWEDFIAWMEMEEE